MGTARGALSGTGSGTGRRIFGSGKGGPSDGRFSQLGEPDDLRPLGHDANVRGGGFGTNLEGGVEEVEMSKQGGIRVDTEVRVDTSERFFYNDRLF